MPLYPSVGLVAAFSPLTRSALLALAQELLATAAVWSLSEFPQPPKLYNRPSLTLPATLPSWHQLGATAAGLLQIRATQVSGRVHGVFDECVFTFS